MQARTERARAGTRSIGNRIAGVPAALLALGLAAVLAGCATPPRTAPETARPQAVPLPMATEPAPVSSQPAAPPSSRERIVRIALDEWQRWGGQTVRIGRDDTACVVSSPLPPPPVPLPLDPIANVLQGLPAPDNTLPSASSAAIPGTGPGNSADIDESQGVAGANCVQFPDGTGMEATAQGCALAQRYWAIVGKEVDCEQITQGRWAWSAVFISWVLRQAGLDESQFLTGESHSMYVVDARDGILPAPAFRVEPVPALPRPGDMICAGRGRDKYLSSPSEIGFGTTPMHCDIVVEVDEATRTVKAIGGNVQQSVSMELVELGESGTLDGFTNSHAPWLLVMRNQLP
ncbi:DUF2272 domain-containing protein [Cupriavidus sp. AU9028]|uniref:DUF2272 domain-containing protein n=1 Tax=Cupriavidus sp. AU9028 TaxID=2871157 RepID=UPI001C962BCA|nr:DUF2272 domain-containing protein [Cupriavidus sp. AU9028]MBY4897695.1 DUF2272 domain-containing protein [Cupriavidus sp. AU9028]